MKTKNEKFWRRADSAFNDAGSWADFMNAIFSTSGLLYTEIQDPAERMALIKSKRFETMRERFEKLVDKFGVIEGSKPTTSGKFLVRLPKTLHQALKDEAKSEGISLNQLVLFKLSVQAQRLRKAI